MNENLDLVRAYKEYYSPSAKAPSVVDVRVFDFFMIDGAGDPRRTAPEKLRTVIRQPVQKRS